jgi:hypothetical protein
MQRTERFIEQIKNEKLVRKEKQKFLERAKQREEET